MFHTQIHIKGKLDPNWSDWFEDMQVLVTPSADTILYGNLPDKSAVCGAISRLSSLGITFQPIDHDRDDDRGWCVIREIGVGVAWRWKRCRSASLRCRHHCL